MKLTLDPDSRQTWPKGRIDAEQLDATTESGLAAQQASDDEDAARDSIKIVSKERTNTTRLVP